jgi:hypothetical protein
MPYPLLRSSAKTDLKFKAIASAGILSASVDFEMWLE